jgi:hypothetical protein
MHSVDTLVAIASLVCSIPHGLRTLSRGEILDDSRVTPISVSYRQNTEFFKSQVALLCLYV